MNQIWFWVIAALGVSLLIAGYLAFDFRRKAAIWHQITIKIAGVMSQLVKENEELARKIDPLADIIVSDGGMFGENDGDVIDAYDALYKHALYYNPEFRKHMKNDFGLKDEELQKMKPLKSAILYNALVKYSEKMLNAKLQ